MRVLFVLFCIGALFIQSSIQQYATLAEIKDDLTLSPGIIVKLREFVTYVGTLNNNPAFTAAIDTEYGKTMVVSENVASRYLSLAPNETSTPYTQKFVSTVRNACDDQAKYGISKGYNLMYFLFGMYESLIVKFYVQYSNHGLDGKIYQKIPFALQRVRSSKKALGFATLNQIRAESQDDNKALADVVNTFQPADAHWNDYSFFLINALVKFREIIVAGIKAVDVKKATEFESVAIEATNQVFKFHKGIADYRPNPSTVMRDLVLSLEPIQYIYVVAFNNR